MILQSRRIAVSRRTAIAALVIGAGVFSLRPALAETFDCIMEPAQKVKIGSSVTGILAEVKVERGDEVKAGQIVARLDTTVEQANLDLTKAQADSVEGIEAQRARVDLARKKLDRAAPLAQKGIDSRDKMEGLEADYEIAQRDLNSEMLKHHIAGIETERAEAALNLRVIKSPLTGLVIDKHLSVGEFVNQEAYIMTLVQLNPLFVEAYIPVSYYGKIPVGMIGTIRPAEPIGGIYKAPVTVVDHVFDAASATYSIRLELKNEGNFLPGGERCRVEFDVPALPLPESARVPEALLGGPRDEAPLPTRAMPDAK